MSKMNKEASILLNELASLGVTFYLEGDKLKSKSRKDVLTKEITNKIKENKDIIIAFLKRNDIGEIALPDIVRFDRKSDVLALSYSQQRLWFIDHLQGGSPEYNMPIVFNVHGILDVSLINDVFAQIIMRHEVLRTVYVKTDDELKQRIRPMSGIDFTIDVEDLCEFTGQKQSSLVKEKVEADIVKTFDLANDVMLRVSYLMTAKDAGVLLFNMHHIASDGWSMEVLTKEFFALFEAFSHGLENPLPELEIQYADYAHWQRTHIAGEVLDKQLNYWEKQLDEVPVVHSLPLGFPRPDEQQYVGAQITSRLPFEVSKQLQALAKQHQLTPFMLLHGALSLLLSRHSNSCDIVIGTPVVNRSQQELAPLIGFFVNTLVLRADTNHDTLSGYFEHIRQVHLDAQANQDVPFEQLVDRLKVPRNTNHSPLFQIMMTTNTDYGVNNDALTATPLAGLTLTPYQSGAVQAKFDLDIDFNVHDEGIDINLVYDVSLFSEQDITRLNKHLCRLLTGLSKVTHGLVTPHSLGMLSKEEAHHLITEFNDTAKDYPKEQCIHELFEQQANQTPDNVAVVFEGSHLTYKALNEQANQLAHYLVEEHRVTPDTLVGLCLERSLDMVVGILGILKAGGAYVPLVPSLPKLRLQYLIEDSKINLVLSDKGSSLNLKSFVDNYIELDSPSHLSAMSHCSSHNLSIDFVAVNARNLAYIIYTSGTTGLPKGVMIEHQACLNHCYGMINRLSLNSSSRIAQTAPLSFDISVWQVITSLLVGGQTVIIKDEVVKSPKDLIAQVNNRKISLLQVVPSLLNVMLEESEVNNDDFTSLKCLSVTGEACTTRLQQLWERAFPNIPLLNAYGPAECADDVLLYSNQEITNHKTEIFSRRESNVRGYCRDYPSLFDKAIGSELFDSSGKRYLDLFCGAGALNYGHNNPLIKPALVEYILSDGITHSLDLFTQAKSHFLEVFERHILKPRALDYKVMFPGPTGANAVEAALKLARKVTGRHQVVHCKNSFHGMTMGALSVTGGDTYKARAGIPLAHTSDIEFIAQNDINPEILSFKAQIESLNELPAAIILEIVQAEGGINIANKQWLENLFGYAKENKILVIVDDIQVGCGRTGRFFSFEHFSVKPDLVCLSKSIGGYGLPMSLVLIRPELDIWAPAEHNGTFRGNNHAFVTGAKAIELYWSNDHFQQDLERLTEQLTNGLNSLVVKYPQLNASHRGIGLIQGIVCEPASLASKIKSKAYERNLIIETAGKNDQIVKFLPALTMTPAQLSECIDVIDSAIGDIVFARPESLQSKTMPIGKPLPNLQVYVAGINGELVPYGNAGELLVAGDSLARGYLNRPELTAQSFVQNPYYDAKNPSSSERLYRTGDLVRYLPDGNFEFIGRVDDQVKIRGFRIELGEVESQLSAQADVDSALVMAKALAGSQQLVGYIKPQEALDEDAKIALVAQVKTGLSTQLPSYMVPSVLMVVNEWPLTPNGKVDRKALPAPDGSALQGEYVAPATETEKTLVEIWSELLNIEPDKISTTANFFELGGHSLLLVRVIGRLRAFKWQPEVNELYRSPSLRDLAVHLDSCELVEEFVVPENLIPADCDKLTPDLLSLISLTQAQIDEVVSQIPSGVRNIQDIYPLGPLQLGMLYHHQVFSTEDVDPYVMEMYFEFSEQSKSAFIDAINIIIKRHDVLRTAFIWQGLSEPVQVVLKNSVVKVIEVEGVDFGDETQRAANLPKMTISKDSGIQLIISAKEAGGYTGVLLYHHIINDHEGAEVLEQEMTWILSGQQEKLSPAVPFRNVIAYLSRQDNTVSRDYFTKQLSSITEPTIPYGIATTFQDKDSTNTQFVMLTSDVSKQIRAWCRTHRLTPAAFFHSVYALVLARISHKMDESIVFGTVLSGRAQPGRDFTNAMGLLINTLPIVLEVGGKSALELVLQSAQRLIGLVSHEQFSLAEAQQCSSIEGNSPLFTALFNYRHNKLDPDASTSNERDSVVEDVKSLGVIEHANYPLVVSLNDYGVEHPFGFSLETDNQIDVDSVTQYLHTASINLLNTLLECETAPCQSIEVLPEEEVVHLIRELNDTYVDYPKDKCIHELFEAQAKSNPDNVALVFEDSQLTYKALNEQANQLAHCLIQEQQVTPDTLVGLCVERSLDMVVGILGILKAGGAYVPLDPSDPQEHLEFMIEDASLTTIVSHAQVSAVLNEFTGHIINLDERDAYAHYSTVDISKSAIGLTSSNLAYVIYTSGPTGKPKGVMVEHLGINAFVSCEKYASVDLSTKVASLSSYTSDGFVYDLFFSLSNALALYLYEQTGVIDVDKEVEKLKFQLQKDGINHFFTTTALFNVLVENNVFADSSVRQVLLGGQRCHLQTVDKFKKLYPGISVVQVYGPTETVVYATACESNNTKEVSSIGNSISNNATVILDNQHRLAPKFSVGELYIGGDSLARGYLNQPELTAQCFIQNPYANANNPNSIERLYRTGDLVRYLPDGNLAFIGRVDDQLKMDGSTIEPTEIEYVAPETETEKVLVEICSILLDIEPQDISTTASFFELGGHSLTIVRLIFDIQTRFEVELPIQDVFDNNKITELAIQIDKFRAFLVANDELDENEYEDFSL